MRIIYRIVRFMILYFPFNKSHYYRIILKIFFKNITIIGLENIPLVLIDL